MNMLQRILPAWLFAMRPVPTYEAAQMPESGDVVVRCSDGRADEVITHGRAMAIHAAVERQKRLVAIADQGTVFVPAPAGDDRVAGANLVAA